MCNCVVRVTVWPSPATCLSSFVGGGLVFDCVALSGDLPVESCRGGPCV